MIQRLIGIVLFCSIFISSASFGNFESDAQLKLKGVLDFKAVSLHSKGTKKNEKKLSPDRGDIAFASSANMFIQMSKEVADSFRYGAQISLMTTTINDRGASSHLYLESDYGKIELGSDKSANHKMKITAYNISCGTGSLWDSFANLSKGPGGISYISGYSNFLDGKTRFSKSAEYARKVSYFTPKINGLQLGISYIPDTGNQGFAPLDKENYSDLNKSSKYKFAIKDGVALGATIEKSFNDRIKIKTALVGEIGKLITKNDIKIEQKFSKVKSYTLGTILSVDQYSLAGSYSNHLSSVTNAMVDKKRKTDIYSFGVRNDHELASFSLTQVIGNNKGNKLNATLFGVEKKVAKGLLGYADLIIFKTKGKSYKNLQNLVSHNVKGTIFILGSKVSF